MATAGLAIVGLAWFVGLGSTLTLPHLAAIRTAVTSTAALFLAFVGASRKRRELVWMAYAITILWSHALAIFGIYLTLSQASLRLCSSINC